MLITCLFPFCFQCEEDKCYGSSIPLSKALDEFGDVLLAYEMNGAPLTLDHGYPIRVVVPGYIGARSVKYLKTITVQDSESNAYFQQTDYKILPEQVNKMMSLALSFFP
jgi:sulfite oxidase